jgi:hypothetical protein
MLEEGVAEEAWLKVVFTSHVLHMGNVACFGQRPLDSFPDRLAASSVVWVTLALLLGYVASSSRPVC